MSKPVVLVEPKFVGREKELEELACCLNSAVKGKGKTVFVSGEAGTGKTKLVTEFLRVVKQGRDVNVLTGQCLSNAAVPYLPFIEAFNSHFFEKESEQTRIAAIEISSWLSGTKQIEKKGKSDFIAPQAWKDLAFAVVVKAICSISEAKPLILFVEDLQWADSASLSLIHFVARSIRYEKVLFIGTFRSEELTTGPEGQVNPLAEELRMMNREDLFTEIKLSNLSRCNINALAGSMIGGNISSDFATQLSEESQGNALFVVESLRMLFERRNLCQKDGEWHLIADTLGIPSKFKEVIMQRLSLLKFNQRRIIDAASVIGEKFDVELLASVLGQNSLEVLECLNAIARSTSLLRVSETFFRFDHAKCRQTIYEEIPLPLKRGYHQRTAEKLENSTGKLNLTEIAYHYGEAGSTEKAVKYSLEAGQDALARFSNVEAINHFEYVMKTINNASNNTATKSIALEGVGDAYFSNGQYRRAQEAFELLTSFGPGAQRLRALRKAMNAVHFGPINRRHEYLLMLAKQAEPYSTYDRLEYARVRFLKSISLPYGQGREDELEVALKVFEEEYSLFDIAKTIELRALYNTFRGEVKRSIADLQRATAMKKELHGDSNELSLTLQTKALIFMNAGLLQETLLSFAESLKIAEKVGDLHRLANNSVVVSRLLEVQGKLSEALSTSLKAQEYYEKTDATRRQDRIWADLARQYAKIGDLPRAEEFLKLHKSIGTGITYDFIDPGGLLNKRDSIRSQAVFFAATNQWKEAYEYLEKAIEIANKIPLYAIFSKIFVRDDYAWTLSKQGRPGEAQLHLNEIQKLYDEVDRNFADVEINATLLAPKTVVSNEEFEVRLDLVNVSRSVSFLRKIEGLVSSKFEVINCSAAGSTKDDSVDMKEKEVGPFELETVRLRLRVSEPDSYNIAPIVTYVDSAGEVQTCMSNKVTVIVKPPSPKFKTLPGRISTGFEDLDALLFGGLPEKSATAIVAPSVEERELLVKKFLTAGAKSGELTFFIAADSNNAKTLIENYSNFFLLVCNPQAEALVHSLPNVFKLNGVESLTNIDIEFVKSLRAAKSTSAGTKRICLGILSDILLQHHSVDTRRWLSAFLPTLKSKGFTILAVIDSQMHPLEELQAVLSLFDGEIRIVERETENGTQNTLKIKKLLNQEYLEDELILNRKRLN